MRPVRGLIVVALAGSALLAGCSSRPESSSPTLPALADTLDPTGANPTPTLGGDGAPPSTFRPTEDCTAINAYRMAECGVGMAPDAATKERYLAGLDAAAARVSENVPDLSDQMPGLVEATKSVGATGDTLPEQAEPVNDANAAVTAWWQDNCV